MLISVPIDLSGFHTKLFPTNPTRIGYHANKKSFPQLKWKRPDRLQGMSSVQTASPTCENGWTEIAWVDIDGWWKTGMDIAGVDKELAILSNIYWAESNMTTLDLLFN